MPLSAPLEKEKEQRKEREKKILIFEEAQLSTYRNYK
jgi:hypothetical protein